MTGNIALDEPDITRERRSPGSDLPVPGGRTGLGSPAAWHARIPRRPVMIGAATGRLAGGGRRKPLLGGNLAVIDDVGARTTGTDIVVRSGWEGQLRRRRERVVAVNEVVAGAATDGVAAEVAP